MRRKLPKIGTEGVWLTAASGTKPIRSGRSRFAFPFACLAHPPEMYFHYSMKSLTVGLPEPLSADIEAESPGRKISNSGAVRERLEQAPRRRRRTACLTAIAGLIGSVDGLPGDLTARKKEYLHAPGYGQKHPR